MRCVEEIFWAAGMRVFILGVILKIQNGYKTYSF